MPNSYFHFKQFTVHQDQCAMKVSTEACILGAWASYDQPNRILDIGTGTGLLSLMLAQRHECPIDAVEIDELAAGQAKHNFLESPWNDRINLFHQPIQEYLQNSDRSYDLIICNPPFFVNHQKAGKIAKQRALHEGDYFDKQALIEAIRVLLSDRGMAFVLYPTFEAEIFQDTLKETGLFSYTALEIYNQPEGGVFRKISLVSKHEVEIETHTLSIRKGTEYSGEFQALLADYYLDK